MSRSSFKDDDEDDRPKKKKAKPVPRRSILKTVGLVTGGAIALSATGIAGRAYQTGAHKNFTDGPGFQPWRDWQTQVDGATPEGQESLTSKPAGMIAAGLLAASPHNSQPWRFIVRDKTIDVLADESRNLGSIDPRYREMMIGLGCCIENMVLGSTGVGITPLVNVLPEGPAGKVIARITLYDGASAPSKEAKALTQRHTNRGPYLRERAVDSKILDTLNTLVSTSITKLVWLRAESEAGKRFAEGTIKATADFIADKNMVVDSYNWFRFSGGDHRDGLTLPTVGIPPIEARIAMMLPKGLMGDPHQAWLDMTRTVHLPTAPLFGLIAIPDLENRTSLIEVGRLWQRLHVQATILGLSMQPLNQMMEMVDRDYIFQRPSEAERTLNNLATLSGNVFAFGFRMGYSRAITFASPRRSIEDVLAS